MTSWGPNRLDLFVIGTDSAMYHKYWDGKSWGPSVSDWERLGGSFIYEPVSVSWGPDRLDVFAIGTDSALYHQWWDGSKWGTWENLGGSWMAKPAVVSWGPNRLDVFLVGTDYHGIHWKSWDGSSWSGFNSLGGQTMHAPSVVSWGPNRIDVFYTSFNSALYRKYWNGSTWTPSAGEGELIGGILTGPPKAVCWGPNRIDVFNLGGKCALYDVAGDGSTGWAWQDFGGTQPFRDVVEVISRAPYTLDVFAIGQDGAVYHKSFFAPGAGQSGNWTPAGSGFDRMGGNVIRDITAVSWDSKRMDLFVVQQDGAVHQKYWTPSGWSSSYFSLGGTCFSSVAKAG